MNWEAIAAVGELVGAFAVLITLIYLAVQIRQNTAAVATSTYESVMTGFNDIKLHERGSLPVAEWRVFAREAAQFFDQPGCKPFRAQNALFADL